MRAGSGGDADVEDWPLPEAEVPAKKGKKGKRPLAASPPEAAPAPAPAHAEPKKKKHSKEVKF